LKTESSSTRFKPVNFYRAAYLSRTLHRPGYWHEFVRILSMENTGVLIFPKWLITSALEQPMAGFGVRVLGDKIDAVAEQAELRRRFPQDEVWERPEQILAPGFVDAHTHLYGVLAHGIPLDKAPSGFMPFLEDFWWPLVEDQLDAEMIKTATGWNCAQMLRSGITSFYDCTEAPFALPGVLEQQAEVVKKWGLRAILSFEATQRVSLENGQLGLAENLQMIEQGRREGGLVQGLMCFHTTFTCSEEFIRQAFQLAAQHGVLTHMHCSEGHYEPQALLARLGMRPIEYYDHLGVLGPEMLASQCIQIDSNEIDLLAARGARVTSMPLSNCEVGGGIAPLPELTSASVTVGLGSDGYITDFFEVMRGAFLIHKASHCDPRVMPAGLVWHLATAGGAKALGLDKVGCIQPGWQADLILITPDLPTPLSAHNLYDQLLLYCNAYNVDSVMVAGQIRKAGREVLGADLGQMRQDTQLAAERLWQSQRSNSSESISA
jgi:5-methylthioadenosine/S-adenosylhomocysteine deaminase